MQLNSKKEQCICVQSKFLKLTGFLKLWNERFQSRVLWKCVSKSKPAASVTAIISQSKDYFQESNIQGLQDMK
jgi:hypothetical protein